MIKRQLQKISYGVLLLLLVSNSSYASELKKDLIEIDFNAKDQYINNNLSQNLSNIDILEDNSDEIEIRYFIPKLKFKLKSSSIYQNNGEYLDFKTTLGVEDENCPEIKIKLNDFDLDYINLNSKGNQQSSNNILFENNKFNTNSNLESNLKVDFWSLNYNQQLHKSNNLDVKLSTGLKLLKFDSSIKGVNTDNNFIEENKKFIAGVPSLGIKASAYTNDKKASAYINLSGLPLGGYGHIYDIDTGFKYMPNPDIKVTAGYRIIDINYINNEDEARYTLKGPYMGINILF